MRFSLTSFGDEKKETSDKPKAAKKQVQVEAIPYQAELRNYLELRRGQIESLIPAMDVLYTS